MQSQWAWLLQLTLCLEAHLKYTTEYHSFFQEVKEGEKWIVKWVFWNQTNCNKTLFDFNLKSNIVHVNLS